MNFYQHSNRVISPHYEKRLEVLSILLKVYCPLQHFMVSIDAVNERKSSQQHEHTVYGYTYFAKVRFKNLSRTIETAGLVKEFRFEKIAPNKYVLHVDGCVWAPHIHKELKPEGVTCSYALIAMAIFEEVLGGKVKVADSEYLKNGTKTRIELL